MFELLRLSHKSTLPEINKNLRFSVKLVIKNRNNHINTYFFHRNAISLVLKSDICNFPHNVHYCFLFLILSCKQDNCTLCLCLLTLNSNTLPLSSTFGSKSINNKTYPEKSFTQNHNKTNQNKTLVKGYNETLKSFFNHTPVKSAHDPSRNNNTFLLNNTIKNLQLKMIWIPKIYRRIANATSVTNFFHEFYQFCLHWTINSLK